MIQLTKYTLRTDQQAKVIQSFVRREFALRSHKNKVKKLWNEGLLSVLKSQLLLKIIVLHSKKKIIDNLQQMQTAVSFYCSCVLPLAARNASQTCSEHGAKGVQQSRWTGGSAKMLEPNKLLAKLLATLVVFWSFGVCAEVCTYVCTGVCTTSCRFRASCTNSKYSVCATSKLPSCENLLIHTITPRLYREV